MSIFYKIIAPNQKISYLFGTIHQNDVEWVTLPLEVKKALDEATSCVFEADASDLMGVITLSAKLCKTWIASQTEHLNNRPQDYIVSAKKNLKKMLDKQTKENPALALVLKLMLSNVLNVTPLSIAQMMVGGVDSSKTSNILDKQLMSYAKLKNKKISYLETAETQLYFLQGFNLNVLEQIELYRLVESTLAQGKKIPGLQESKMAYRQQDINKLHDLLRRPFSFISNVPVSEPVDRYYHGISTHRDLQMAENMKPSLDHGNAFLAVGASHLKGVIEKLQSEGYTIEAVPLGKRHYAINGTLEDGEKVAAFRKIYAALYMAQSSFFKERCFIPNDDAVVSLMQIQEYTHSGRYSRSAKAWELAERYYKNISSANSELLKAICHEGYAKSSSVLGLFRRTKTNLDDARSVAEASPETRTGTVRDILNGPSI